MSTTKMPSTVNCPRCQAQLPGWSQKCQFCGAAVTNVERPADAYKYAIDNRLDWKDKGYIVISVIFCLNGIYGLLVFLKVLPGPDAMFNVEAIHGILGSINLLAGIGLLFHVLWVQYITRLYCILSCVICFWQMLTIMLIASSSHLLKSPVLTVGLYVYNFAFYAFSWYLINQVGDVGI